MQLTQFSDYSLRTLIYAGLKAPHQSSITEIAEAYDINRPHLVKVVHFLSEKGYLATKRGRGGGLTLGLAPRDIKLGQLVRTTEQNLAIVECLGDSDNCVITSACALKPILGNALKAFFDHLDEYTLADVIAAPCFMNDLLGIALPEEA